MSDTWSMPTRIVQFGDGYAERSPDGLNQANEVWDVECAFGISTPNINLQTFLESVGGWQAFLWKSPRDRIARPYVIVQPVGGAVRRGGGDKPYFYTRSLKFKRVYIKVVPINDINTINTINGTSDDETLIGTTGADLIYSNGGSDNLIGGGGNDTLIGGSGGNDTITSNTLNGTNDLLLGGGEQDVLVGGAGTFNTFVLGDLSGCYYLGADSYASIVNFNPDYDTIQLSGLAANYVLVMPATFPGTAFLYHLDALSNQDLIAKITTTSGLDLNVNFAYV